jgi:photosystem II stability/assembly factor-like uncharacterized protein
MHHSTTPPVSRPDSVRKRAITTLFCCALFLALGALAQNQPARFPDYHLQEAEYQAMLMRDENGKIPHNAMLNAIQQKQQMHVDARAWPGSGIAASAKDEQFRTAGIDSASWTWVGPGNIGGRVRSILVHPTTPTTMWAGGVGGGIWKSLNSGASWFPLNDFMANLAIGCMVMDPTNPNVIYAGTGEGFSNADALRGAGIFKSLDGGASWTQLPSTTSSSFYYVNRLAVCPTNNLILIAATGSGIWRSTDGGTNWSQRYSSGAILDCAFHPTDGLCIASGSTYGSAGRALYSLDGGLSWTPATGFPSVGRIEVAYAASSPNIVYASVNNNSGEVYVSSDGGQTYSFVSNPQHVGGQGWYDNCIWVDPTNPNILMVGGTDVYRSINGGASFTDIGGYAGSIHPDQHIIINTPAFDGSTVRTIFVGNDGGLFRATDAYSVSSGSGWATLNHNLGITQFYGAAGNSTSGTIVGGTQDNGTLRDTSFGGTSGWTSMFGGDGGFCAADQSDPNYFYGEYVYLQIHRSSNGGLSSSYITSGLGDAGVPGGGGDPDGQGPDGDPDSSANFIAPFILDLNNFNTMLAGGSNLWRSVNVKASPPTWTNIKPGGNGSFISAIAVAPGNSDIIWVGHNNGDVYATANGTSFSPTWTRMDLGTPNLPNRTCTRLTIDSNNWNVVYATFGGFSSDNVYRTTDGGITWANIAGGLPVAPVRSLVIAPFNSSFLYVGSDVGVFASPDGGATWSPGNEGAANAAVDELFWMNNYLVAATHGRGIYKILVTVAPSISLASAVLASENCPPTNGVIDPGETVTVNFTLTNAVSIPTTNLTATLLVTNGVVSPSGPQNYGALVGGGAAVTKAFTFMATGQCGGAITATLQLKDGTLTIGNVSATFPLGSAHAPLTQNFDSVSPPALPAGWTFLVSGPTTAWQTTTAARDTLPNSAFAPDVPSVSDNSLISPAFAILTASAQLTFRHNYYLENTYDGGVLEISVNGGAFTDIIAAGGSFVTGGYNNTISTCCSNPLGGRQGWSGNSSGFITTTVNLPPSVAGQAVQLRWRVGCDSSVNNTGWYVDTVSVSDGFSCCVSIPRPSITAISRSGTNVFLTWSATPGVSYRLQYNTNLNTTNWFDADDILASGSSVSVTNFPATDEQRYYRVRQLP